MSSGMINKKIKGCYPMHIDSIIFDDGFVLEDKIGIILNNGFLAVEVVEESAPNLYNIDRITSLIGVSEIRPSQKPDVW